MKLNNISAKKEETKQTIREAVEKRIRENYSVFVDKLDDFSDDFNAVLIYNRDKQSLSIFIMGENKDDGKVIKINRDELVEYVISTLSDICKKDMSKKEFEKFVNDNLNKLIEKYKNTIFGNWDKLPTVRKTNRKEECKAKVEYHTSKKLQEQSEKSDISWEIDDKKDEVIFIYHDFLDPWNSKYSREDFDYKVDKSCVFDNILDVATAEDIEKLTAMEDDEYQKYLNDHFEDLLKKYGEKLGKLFMSNYDFDDKYDDAVQRAIDDWEEDEGNRRADAEYERYKDDTLFND